MPLLRMERIRRAPIADSTPDAKRHPELQPACLADRSFLTGPFMWFTPTKSRQRTFYNFSRSAPIFAPAIVAAEGEVTSPPAATITMTF